MDKHWENLSENLKLSDESRERIRAQLVTRPIHQEGISMKKKTAKLRFGIALAAAMSLLTVTTFALFPSLRELIRLDLGPKAPYATEVLGSCEDQGITITAQNALTDGRMTQLYFTVHDPSGVFFLEDTTNDLFMDFLAGEEKIPADAGRRETALEQLSYDPESQTGLYVFRAGPVGYDSVTPPTLTHATLTMSNYLPGSRGCATNLHGPASKSKSKKPAPSNILESTTENGTVVLQPNQTPQLIDENTPENEVAISSAGFASDGYYHIRFRQGENVVQTWVTNYDGPAVDVVYLMESENSDRTVHQYDEAEGVITTAVSDGWDFCLSFLTPESYERLKIISISSRYSVEGGYQEGNWELTVPLQNVEAVTATPAEPLILSRTKDSPPPSGESHEAQVSSVSVSPISVVADFTRPENYHLCADVDGFAIACTVTLSDGFTIEPVFFREAWNGNGWVMWEFEQPILPAQVVSVSLNGNEIPFN